LIKFFLAKYTDLIKIIKNARKLNEKSGGPPNLTRRDLKLEGSSSHGQG
jgi:hypothetical protein